MDDSIEGGNALASFTDERSEEAFQGGDDSTGGSSSGRFVGRARLVRIIGSIVLLGACLGLTFGYNDQTSLNGVGQHKEKLFPYADSVLALFRSSTFVEADESAQPRLKGERHEKSTPRELRPIDAVEMDPTADASEIHRHFECEESKNRKLGKTKKKKKKKNKKKKKKKKKKKDKKNRTESPSTSPSSLTAAPSCDFAPFSPTAQPSYFKPSRKPSMQPTPVPSSISLVSEPTVQPTYYTPETFDQNARATRLENDKIIFEFVDLEAANGNVFLTFYHRGDNSQSGSFSFKAGGFSLGKSQTGEFTACTVYVKSPADDPIADDAFNSQYVMNGTLTVSMEYDDSGDPDANTCTGEQVAYVNLRYQIARDSEPTSMPSLQPPSSPQPSFLSSPQPTLTTPTSDEPSSIPSSGPTPTLFFGSTMPSFKPSMTPFFGSTMPSSKPSTTPFFGSTMPSSKPSTTPFFGSTMPSFKPSTMPSSQPSTMPSPKPSTMPSPKPSTMPSSKPSLMPSSKPSPMPSSKPSAMPSTQPSTTSMPSSCIPQFYDQNSTVMGLENGEILFEFTGLETAIGNVQITYFHKGDNSDSGFYSLKVDQFSFGESETGKFTPCMDYVKSLTDSPIADDTFNGLVKDGNLNVSMEYDDFGGNTCLDDQMAFANVRYQFSDCPSSMPSMPSMPSMQPSSTPSEVPDEPSSMPSMSSSKPSPMPSLSSKPSSCTPQFYDQNSTVMSLVGTEMNFEFTSLEPATGNVQIAYFHKGDNSESGTYVLKANIFTVGESETGEFTPCMEYVKSLTDEPITDDKFNDEYVKGGNLKVSMEYEDLGDPAANTCTDDQMAFVNLRYPYTDCPQPSSDEPSSAPSSSKSSSKPPSEVPSSAPSKQSDEPSSAPSSSQPSSKPSSEPTKASDEPSSEPSSIPSDTSSSLPSLVPSQQPSSKPSLEPSSIPSDASSSLPSLMPSQQPSLKPSLAPMPSTKPSDVASSAPSKQSDKPSSAPSSSQPSFKPSSEPTKPPEVPSSAPSSSNEPSSSSKPSEVPSMMPSCPITSVDVVSPQLNKTAITCPDQFPDFFTCSGFEYDFNNVEKTIGNATITYVFKNDNQGSFDLSAGTYDFGSVNEDPMCIEQSKVVIALADDFNRDSSANPYFVRDDGVLNLKMLFNEVEDANTCGEPQSVATFNLKYDYFDCGTA